MFKVGDYALYERSDVKGRPQTKVRIVYIGLSYLDVEILDGSFGWTFPTYPEMSSGLFWSVSISELKPLKTLKYRDLL